ncbi:ATP-binding protein [Spirillospora sp. NPDC029432]|uniref:sensor histidine kinase n=1 Tax=Spirillospora sp. NPDC029432 TaxID=3154599 RepID=UPI003451A7E6
MTDREAARRSPRARRAAGPQARSAARARPERGPSDHALARTVQRFTVALRCGGVVAAAIAAGIGGGAGISRAWQLGVLAVLAAWSVLFTATALRRGLSFPLVAGDSAVVALVLLAQERYIPEAAAVDETTWAIMLASTAVYVALLALRPLAALPPVALVIAAYVAGAPAVTSQVRVLIVQTVAVAAIMELLRRGGRRADAIVADRDRDRRRALVEAARRADERHHRAQMHDSVLATLTMVASGALRAGSPGLERGAREGLEVLEEFAAPASGDGPPVDVAARLRAVAADSGIEVAVSGPGRTPVMVPEPVAHALAGAAGEALRNAARHAGTGRAALRVAAGDGTVTVEVADAGRGFDPGRVPAGRHGIARSIRQRMAAAGGGVTVRSRPGEGTRVVLRWPGG